MYIIYTIYKCYMLFYMHILCVYAIHIISFGMATNIIEKHLPIQTEFIGKVVILKGVYHYQYFRKLTGNIVTLKQLSIKL